MEIDPSDSPDGGSYRKLFNGQDDEGFEAVLNRKWKNVPKDNKSSCSSVDMKKSSEASLERYGPQKKQSVSSKEIIKFAHQKLLESKNAQEDVKSN